MFFPEEPVTWCEPCGKPVPHCCIWRTYGTVISKRGHKSRARVVRSICPACGRENSVALGGDWFSRNYYSWLWSLRYPSVRHPEAPRPEDAMPLPQALPLQRTASRPKRRARAG